MPHCHKTKSAENVPSERLGRQQPAPPQIGLRQDHRLEGNRCSGSGTSRAQEHLGESGRPIACVVKRLTPVLLAYVTAAFLAHPDLDAFALLWGTPCRPSGSMTLS